MNTDNFKKQLEEEKEKLISGLQTVGRINPDNPGDWEATPGDINERSADQNKFASNIEEYETHTAILKQLETQLLDVNDALQKIEEGKYGTCDKCGKEIEAERLGANPAARTCEEHMNDEE